MQEEELFQQLLVPDSLPGAMHQTWHMDLKYKKI